MNRESLSSPLSGRYGFGGHCLTVKGKGKLVQWSAYRPQTAWFGGDDFLVRRH